MRSVFAFTLAAALCFTASPAAAEKAILFAPAGHSDLAASLGPAVITALEQGLAQAGWQSLSPEEAGARLDELGVARCSGDLCVPEMLQALEADTAIGVAIWARHGETAPYEIALTMMPRVPPSVNATARVHDGDVTSATREALTLALTRWSRRHVITLRVLGEPAGAAITVDGRPAGRLPYETHLDAGEHDVSVSQRGRVTQRHEVEIPEEGEAVVVRVDLAMDAASVVAPEASRAREPSAQMDASPRRRPIVGPALLAAGGVAGTAWGAWASSRGGCLEHNAMGDCTRQRRFSGGEKAGHAAALIGGGLALVGAVLWFSLGGQSAQGPEVELGVGPGEARFRLHF
ncbi:MAG: PEGA domain-containing protein [Deltaproteobacteria bacterium]|nr:PEGA domain-containing protein [Deltaproteobacteria bacterium]